MKNRTYGLKKFILRSGMLFLALLLSFGFFAVSPITAEASFGEQWHQGEVEDQEAAAAEASNPFDYAGKYFKKRLERLNRFLTKKNSDDSGRGSGEDGVPVNNTSYKSWLTEPAVDAYKRVDSSVPQVEASHTSAISEISSNWLVSSIEDKLAEMVASVANSLDKAFRKTGADITISGIVMGKVATGKNLWQFDLSDTNIYGRLGAVIYVCLRAISLTFLLIFVALNIIKSLLYNDQKAWTELKSSVMGGVAAIVVITIMPQIVDWLCNLRDVLSLWMYKTASAYTVGDGDTAGAIIGETLNISDQYLKRYTEHGSLVNALVYMAIVLMPLAWVVNYVRIALSQVVLFGSFPVFCAAGARDKKAIANWSAVFFTNIFIPSMDIVLIMLPSYIMAMIENSVTEVKGDGFVILNAVITITAFMFIIPARNMLLRMLGNYFGIQMGGGLFAAGAAVGAAVGTAVGAASSIAGGGLKAIGGLGRDGGGDDGGDDGDKMSDGGDKKSGGGSGLSDHEMQENMKTPDEIPSSPDEDKNGIFGSDGEGVDGKTSGAPDGGEMPLIPEEGKDGIDVLGGADGSGENSELEEITKGMPENGEIPPEEDGGELPPELDETLDDNTLEGDESITPPEEAVTDALAEDEHPVGEDIVPGEEDKEIPMQGDDTVGTVSDEEQPIEAGAGTGFSMPDDAVISDAHDKIEEDLTAASANMGMGVGADLPEGPKLDEFAGLGRADVDRIREDTLTDKGATVEDAADNVKRANNLGAIDNLKENIGKLDSYGQGLASEVSDNKLEQAQVSTDMKELRNKQKDFLDHAERDGKKFVNPKDKEKNDRYNADYHVLAKKQVQLEQRGHELSAQINANNSRKAVYEQELSRRRAVEAKNAAVAQKRYGTAKPVTYESADAFRNSLKHNARMNKLANYKNYNSSDFKGTMTVKQRVQYEQAQRRAEAMGQVASGATRAAAACASAFATVGMMSAGPEEALRAGRAVRDAGSNLADYNRDAAEYVASGQLKSDVVSAGSNIAGTIRTGANKANGLKNDVLAKHAERKARKTRQGVGDVQRGSANASQNTTSSTTKAPSRKGTRTLEGQGSFSFEEKKVDKVMRQNLNNSHPDNRKRDQEAKAFVDNIMKDA